MSMEGNLKVEVYKKGNEYFSKVIWFDDTDDLSNPMATRMDTKNPDKTLRNRKIIGTVGELQFDVIQYRLEHEYGAKSRFNMMNVYKACWITSTDKDKLEDFVKFRQHQVATDKDGNLVYLADSQWMLDQMIKNYPEVQFHFTSEFKRAALV